MECDVSCETGEGSVTWPEPGGGDEPPTGPSARVRASILVLFFLSGASSLALQTIWVRQLRGVLGSGVHAVSTVLAVFMAGLALGSLLAARIPVRRHPLRVYAALQWGIAGLGVLSVLLLGQTGPVCSLLYRRLGGNPFLLDAARYAFSLVVLLLPATLMGATLPVLSRFVSAQRSAVGVHTGLLYGLNTLGAALGCALTGFVLLGTVGIRLTGFTAATVNLAVGVFAWWWAREAAYCHVHAAAAGRVEGGVAGGGGRAYTGVRRRLVLAAFGVAGFCGLGYEVLWTRGLVFFLGNTVYAFTTVLTACLIGIAVGSVVAAPVADRVRSRLATFGVLEVLIGCWALLLLVVIGLRASELVRLAEHYPVWRSTTAGLCRGFIAVLIPTVLMGAAFPVATCACARRGTDLARDVGVLYACNTLGAIVGSAATGFLLMPRLGLEGAVVALAVVNLALGALLVGADNAVGRRRRVLGVAAIAGLACVGLGLKPGHVFRRLHQLGRPDWTIVAFREDPAGTVTVIDNGTDRRILVDSIDVAGTSESYTDSSTALAHIPLLVHPDPRDVFVLGFGAGGTASSISMHPTVRRLDAAELCRSVVAAAPMFEAVNRNVMADPRLNLVVADGREFLLTTHRTYDVISIDLLLAASAGSGSLYTREFYDLCRSRLSDGGIAAQWISPAHIPLPMLKTILRTAQSVFPYTALWFSARHHHLVLLAADARPTPAPDRMAERLRVPAIKADLQRIGLADPTDMIHRLVADGDELVRFAGAGPVNTDDLPLIEYLLPTSDLTLSRLQNLAALHDVRDWDGRDAWVGDPVWRERLIATAAAYRKELDAALAYEYSATGCDFAEKGDTRQALALWQQALALNDEDPATHYSIGVVLSREGPAELAIAAFRRVTQLAPNLGEAHNNLGGLLAMTGDLRGAERHLRIAATLSPGQPAARTNLAGVLVQLGRPTEAIAEYESVLQVFPDYEPARLGLADARRSQAAP